MDLAGSTVLVTRANDDSGLAKKLMDRGATVIELTVLAISDPDSWRDFDRAILKDGFDWVIFASQNAVRQTISRLTAIDKIDFLNDKKIAAVGLSTAQFLKDAGRSVDYTPPDFVSESFVDNFAGYPELAGLRIFLPQASGGRPLIEQKLSAAGADVTRVDVYKSSLPVVDADSVSQLLAKLQNGDIDFVTLKSSQSARNLATILSSCIISANGCAAADASAANTTSLHQLFERCQIVAIGPVTAATTLEVLGRLDATASPHDDSGMVEAVAVLKSTKKAV